MAALLALAASALTSLLPILNKRLLQQARPAFVAWAVNAASLPLLAAGTALLTQCAPTAPRMLMLTCTARLPSVDGIFVLALAGSVALNGVATLLSTRALASADASLVSPLLTFAPAFTLLVAWPVLGETPAARQTIGVGIILLGAYVLDVQEIHTGLLEPLRTVSRRLGAVLAVLASACWGVTTVLEKVAIQHARPPNGPLVALASTALMVLLLTPGAFLPVGRWRWRRLTLKPRQVTGGPRASHSAQPRDQSVLCSRRWSFLSAALIAGVAPLFGFTAIALGLVGYVTALFKLSAILTIVWARLLLGEKHVRPRLLGAAVMLAGGALVAV